MEIVLQWLDELDDLVFAGLALWRRLRRLCLGVALAAAAALVIASSLDALAIRVSVLLLIALTALASWALFALIGKGAAASRHSMGGRA